MSVTTFTLDTNCIIDLEENQNQAEYVRTLIAAHTNGNASVAYVAQSASEKQQNGKTLESYAGFRDRIDRLGMLGLEKLMTIAYFDISYWDQAILADDEGLAREREIHRTLFPKHSFDFSSAEKIDGEQWQLERLKWRNRKCDTLIYWAHDRSDRDIFVTCDKNFKKLDRSSLFPSAKVLTPMEASRLV